MNKKEKKGKDTKR